jgi:ABC-type transport system substrate-binding protein
MSRVLNAKVTRRQALHWALAGTLGAIASACAGPTPTPKIVQQTVVVKETQVVKETSVVQQTKIVEQTKVVQQQIRVGNPATLNSDRICIIPGRAALCSGFWGFVTNTAWQFGFQTDWTIHLPLFTHFDVRPDPVDGDSRRTDKPLLVDKRDVAADRSKIDFHIRNEALWSDGKPLTSKDVQYTLELIYHKDAKMPSGLPNGYVPNLKGGAEYLAGKADKITGIVVKDDKSFTLEFDPPLPATLGLMHMVQIVPQHVLSKYAPGDIWQGKFPEAFNPTVTSGPYKVAKWDPAQKYLELVRIEDWWGNAIFGKPGIKRIAEKAGMGVTQLIAGECDLNSIATTDIQAIKDSKKFNIFDQVTMTMQFLFNQAPERKLPMKVQRAICYAMDRAVFRESVNFGFGEIPPASIFQATEPIAPVPVCKTCKGPMFEEVIKYDPAKAKALFAEAAKEGGWDPARKLQMIGGDQDCVLIQQFLKAVGVESEILTGAELTAAALKAGKYDIWLNFLFNNNTPMGFTNQFTAASFDCAASTWWSQIHWCDDEFRQIVVKELYPAKVGTPAFDAVWQKIADYWDKQGFVWSLRQIPNLYAVNKDLAGFAPDFNVNSRGQAGEYGIWSWYWAK